MKTINIMVCGLALVAGCFDAGKLGSTDELLTGSGGSGIGVDAGTGSGGGGGGSGGGGNASVFHTTWNGHAASVNSMYGLPNIQIEAQTSGTGVNRTASLQFAYTGPDPSSQVCYSYYDYWSGQYVTYCYYTQFISEYGWGSIPSADLTIAQDASSAHLHVTTDANVSIQRCSWNWWQWIYNCTYGGSETFDIRWDQNHASSTETIGTTRETFGVYTFHSQGSMLTNSADVTGTAFGQSLGSSNGLGLPAFISDSRGTSVSRDVYLSH